VSSFVSSDMKGRNGSVLERSIPTIVFGRDVHHTDPSECPVGREPEKKTALSLHAHFNHHLSLILPMPSSTNSKFLRSENFSDPDGD